MKPQAKLVPLATACSLSPRASLGSRPPGHRTQQGHRPDAIAALGPAPGSHLWVRGRVRTAFSLLQSPARQCFLESVQLLCLPRPRAHRVLWPLLVSKCPFMSLLGMVPGVTPKGTPPDSLKALSHIHWLPQKAHRGENSEDSLRSIAWLSRSVPTLAT